MLEIVLSCFDLLVRELQSEAVDASRVVLIGMSVGGGLVIDVAVLAPLGVTASAQAQLSSKGERNA